METIPGYAEPFPPAPPPPPPQRSRKGLWIGLGIGAVVLCLCCLAIGVVAFLNWTKITNYFYSQTAQSYSNADAGISLYYPQTWQYEESGDAAYGYSIFFASSSDILTGDTRIPQTGALFAIWTMAYTSSDFAFSVDASSMGDVVDYASSDILGEDMSPVQNLHNFTLNGFPAASGIYTGSIDTSVGDLSEIYLVAVLRNEEIVIFLGVCPETEWTQYRTTFDSILNSVELIAQ
jgi:hypothetical protein